MKKLLLPILLALAATHARAGDEVIAFTSGSTGIGVLRGGGNLYRPIPRGGSISNLTAKERYRAVLFRPTQHFYLKDNVVSYRYAAEELARVGSEFGGSYHGPHAAQFVPNQHALAPHGRMRAYASVNKRPQPGVPMIARSSRITRSVSSAAPVTSIQLVSAK